MNLIAAKSGLVGMKGYRKTIGGQYRGTFLVPVPSVLLWYRYRYRGTLLFFGGTGTLVLFFSRDFTNVIKNLKRCKNACA